MNRTQSYVGPRGWAVLTLAGGALLASPFLRTPQIDSALLERGAATNLPTWSTTLSDRNDASSSHLAAGAASLLPGRKVSGTLPTTLPTAASELESWKSTDIPVLPPWIAQRSPLDELIARTNSTEPATEMTIDQAVADLQPLRTWRGGRLPAEGAGGNETASAGGNGAHNLVAEPGGTMADRSSLAQNPHQASPWEIAQDATSVPSAHHTPSTSRSDAKGWAAHQSSEPKWPDQTLGHAPQELVHRDSHSGGYRSGSPSMAPAGNESRQLDEAAQRTVAASLPPSVRAQRPTVIGATLSRSTPTASHQSSPLASGASIASTSPALPSASDDKRFVVQPRLRNAN